MVVDIKQQTIQDDIPEGILQDETDQPTRRTKDSVRNGIRRRGWGMRLMYNDAKPTTYTGPNKQYVQQKYEP